MTSSKPRTGSFGPRQQITFDRTSDVFATGSSGEFQFPLVQDENPNIDTSPFDEGRFVVSLWHPSANRAIDLDRAYVECRMKLDPEDEHWIKVAEIEPVVPASRAGDRFDGWIILPVFAKSTAYAIGGSGFDPRARLQIRAAVYLVG